MKGNVYAFALLAMAVVASTAWAAPRKFEAITLERGGCFGTCPIYKVTVTADGSVTYVGDRWVKAVGKRTKHLSRARVNRIKKAIVDLEFFALRDKYGYQKGDGCQVVATDAPGVTIVVKAGGDTKSIEHYLGCEERPDPKHPYVWPIFPRHLTAFEDEIDRLIGTREWVGSAAWRARERKRRMSQKR